MMKHKAAGLFVVVMDMLKAANDNWTWLLMDLCSCIKGEKFSSCCYLVMLLCCARKSTTLHTYEPHKTVVHDVQKETFRYIKIQNTHYFFEIVC